MAVRHRQKDPRMRFKEEGYRIFAMMNDLIHTDVARVLFRLQIQAAPEEVEGTGPSAHLDAGGFKSANAPESLPAPAAMPAPARSPAPDLLSGPVPGRPAASDPCPCGSGMSFKNCHGK